MDVDRILLAIGRSLVAFPPNTFPIVNLDIPKFRLVFGGGLILLCLTVLLFVSFSREKKISIDNKQWAANGISGRPDATTQRFGKTIPHEYKSRKCPSNGTPNPQHVTQVLAYCYILEKNGYSVTKGVLHYNDRIFEIPWTDNDRKAFEHLAYMARKDLWNENVVPKKLSRGDPRCLKCPFRHVCWGRSSRRRSKK